MTESSYWWTTGSAGDGASTYTRSDLALVAKILGACSSHEGVAPKWLNTLNATSPAVNTLRVQSGGALVDGKPYYNSANADVTIPSAVGAGNTRIDRVVLRANWTAQTVRLTRIAGTDAVSPSIPAITQNSGTTYDIPLYRVLVDTSGNCTVTDERIIAGELFAIAYQIGDGYSAITAGVKGDFEIPFNGIISQVSLTADAVGSIVIDIWKDTYANFPPTVADTITSSAKPTLSASQKSQDTTLTGWTKVLAAGDWLRINVDSAATVKLVTLSIRGYKL
jgi:hypothetical protein